MALLKPNKMNVDVDFSAIVDDPTINNRDPLQNLFSQTLLNDLIAVGQKEPILLMKTEKGDFWIIQGNRRTFHLKYAYHNGIVCQATGKPFPPTVRAHIYEPMPIELFRELQLDDTARLSLSKVDTYFVFKHLRDAGLDQRNATWRMRPTLDRHYDTTTKNRPNGVPEDDTPENRKEYELFRKGALQPMNAWYNAPTVLADLYMDAVRTGKRFPKYQDLKVGVEVFQKERQDHKNRLDFTIDQSNPGPLFKQWFNEQLVKIETAESEGNEPKTASRWPVSKIESQSEVCKNTLVRVIFAMTLNKFSDELCKVVYDYLNTAKVPITSEEFVNGLNTLTQAERLQEEELKKKAAEKNLDAEKDAA